MVSYEAYIWTISRKCNKESKPLPEGLLLLGGVETAFQGDAAGSCQRLSMRIDWKVWGWQLAEHEPTTLAQRNGIWLQQESVWM